LFTGFIGKNDIRITIIINITCFNGIGFIGRKLNKTLLAKTIFRTKIDKRSAAFAISKNKIWPAVTIQVTGQDICGTIGPDIGKLFCGKALLTTPVNS